MNKRFYIISFFTVDAHLIEQSIFNTKRQVVLVLKHSESKQRNIHKHFIRLYLVFSIGFASKCIITVVRRMFDTHFNCLLQIN